MRGYRYQSSARNSPMARRSEEPRSPPPGWRTRQRFLQNWGFTLFTDAAEVTARGVSFPVKYGVGAGAGLLYYTSIGPIRAQFALPAVKLPNSGSFELYVASGRPSDASPAACIGMVAIATLMAASGAAQASILDRLLSWASGSVATQGLAIHWGGELTADRVELRDPKGAYAALEKVIVQWSPLQLIHGAIDVSLLSATHAEIMRMPESSSGKSSMPSKIVVKQLRLERVDVDKPVVGTAVALKVDASGQRVGLITSKPA